MLLKAKEPLPLWQKCIAIWPDLVFNDPVPENSLVELILLCRIFCCEPQVYLSCIPSEGVLQVSSQVDCNPSLQRTDWLR